MTEQHSSESKPSVWHTAFDEQDRQTQLLDDSVAWHYVAGLLLAVVAVGLVLAVIAVLLSV
jgi:hypothetical protein